MLTSQKSLSLILKLLLRLANLIKLILEKILWGNCESQDPSPVQNANIIRLYNILNDTLFLISICMGFMDGWGLFRWREKTRRRWRGSKSTWCRRRAPLWYGYMSIELPTLHPPHLLCFSVLCCCVTLYIEKAQRRLDDVSHSANQQPPESTGILLTFAVSSPRIYFQAKQIKSND